MLTISNDEYHARSELSKSQLDLINQDINGIEWAKNAPIHGTKIKTFNFGNAMHTLILEPHKIDEFIYEPKVNKRTNAGKEEIAEFHEANKGKTILTFDEWEKLQAMFGSIMAHPGARKLVEAKGVAEGTWTWIDPESGVECRCRPDKDLEGTPFLLDVKTTDSISKFQYSVEDYRYYVQEPFYVDGLRANGIDKARMIFLVIQKTVECGRYPLKVCTLPEQLVEFGRDEYKRNLMEYAQRDPNQIVTELQVNTRLMRSLQHEQY